MPFIGQDWRAPGETWIRTPEGWEQMKLRPYGTATDMARPLSEIVTSTNDNGGLEETSSSPIPPDRHRSSSESSSENSPIFMGGTCDELETEMEDGEDWLPHCFVKTGKSKEFVGCTSVSEAFHKLNMARAVTDIQRFNYVCKVVQILVRDKLQNLSGSARKVLLSVVEAIVLHNLETFTQVKTVTQLVSDFMGGLNGGHHCGSPKLLTHHQDAVSNLYELLSCKQPSTPADSREESVTFLDLPRECLRAILRRLPDHDSLLEAAKAHEALEYLVESEQRLWQGLCRFHFTEWQVASIQEKLRRRRQNNPVVNSYGGESASTDTDISPIIWRHAFFELKKFYGLKESYADMIHICCHCKALFWKKLGHPCVSNEQQTTSVRVTPQQFVDMLMFL